MRIVSLLMMFCAAASAQMPDKFTNLQFFPKDISRQELMGVMRTFSFSVGVRCTSCHEAKPDGSTDFATDSKDMKKTARLMLQMVQNLNHDYIGKLAGSPRVECATCHHGLSKPQSLQAVLANELDSKGLPAAITLYRELRKKYYGGGQYDFGETSLNQLTESLQAKHKTQEAVAFMELNDEVNPMTGWGKNLLAMAHLANGQTDKALADFEAIVQKNPSDTWAKGELEKLKSAKK